MDSLSKNASARYAMAVFFIAASAISLMLDLVFLRPGPPTLQQKAFGALLGLFTIYTQVSLRAYHVYYRKMVQHGCAPISAYPDNALGILFLLEAAKGLKENRFLQLQVKNLETFGRTFQARMFPETFVTIVSDEPEIMKAVLSTKFDDWILPENRIRGFMPVLGYHSIFTTNGPEWQHSRSMLRPAFLRDQISDLACFDRHIMKMVRRIPKDGSRFDLQALFAMLTIDSISDFMFGQSTDILGSALERDVKFGTFFDASLLRIGVRARLGWVSRILPDRELDIYTKFIRNYVDDFVEQRKRAKTVNSDKGKAQKYVFLDALLRTGEPDEVVRNQLLSIFLAGRDTTTSVMTYLFLELSQRPEVVSKIQEEIQQLNVETPTWEQLKNMKYLHWTIREAMRLNPPVPSNSREAVRDTVLPRGGGPDGKSPSFVAKGTIVRYQIWSTHRRKDIFGEDADVFRPERWETLRVG